MTILLEASRYAAVNAQTRGLLARLISDALWTELVSASSLGEQLDILGRSEYTDRVANVVGEPTVALLERALLNHLARASRLPLRLMQGGSRELLDWYWRRFEVNNLKMILRARHYGTAVESFRDMLIPLGSSSKLPWDALIAADSVVAVVNLVRRSAYGPALDDALERYRREAVLFVLEVALDLSYTHRLLKLVAKLRGRDRREATRFIGAWVDAQNLLWAYRYRIYAHFSPEEILNYTLHSGLRVNAERIRAIALGAPLLDVVSQIWGDILPGLETLEGLPDRQALPKLELILQRHLWLEARQALGGYPLSLATVLAYEILLESEVYDLMALAEGKAVDWTAEQIRPYLIGERG
jgi:V/A-type H+-transporting ATPase subunit C